MNKEINTMYFSATGTTSKIVTEIANSILRKTNFEKIIRNIDFTSWQIREKPVNFNEKDIVIIGVPVYAGRVPNVLLKYLNTIKGNGTLAVAVVVYGNRNYDDALIELKDILELNGFTVFAAGAFIGEHSFSKILANNRPDEKDLNAAQQFGNEILMKLNSEKKLNPIEVKGNKPYRNYYKPKDKDGNAVDIRKVTPKTNSSCINCKLCISVCPMGSIDAEDVSRINGICIKCGACIKKCPVSAKYYDDADYLRHKSELEMQLCHRKEPELFI